MILVEVLVEDEAVMHQNYEVNDRQQIDAMVEMVEHEQELADVIVVYEVLVEVEVEELEDLVIDETDEIEEFEM